MKLQTKLAKKFTPSHSTMQLDKIGWKQALSMEVFDWISFAVDQTKEKILNEKWRDGQNLNIPDGHWRYDGWMKAVNIVCSSFTSHGKFGASIILCPEEHYNVFTSWTLGENGWSDPIKGDGRPIYYKTPDEIVSELYEEVEKAMREEPATGINSASSALECCLRSILTVRQNYTCHHDFERWHSYSYPEDGESGYTRKCLKCELAQYFYDLPSGLVEKIEREEYQEFQSQVDEENILLSNESPLLY